MNLNEYHQLEYNKIFSKHAEKAKNEFKVYLKSTESVIKYLSDKEPFYFHRMPSRYAYIEYVEFCQKSKLIPVGKKKFSWLMIQYGFDMTATSFNGKTMRVFIVK